jgi:hypothetical protein
MQDKIAALTAERDAFQRNARDTWAAMSAMRDSINEVVPMPSLESDLLQGPENSVFCATVAEAVINAIKGKEKCLETEFATGANTNGQLGSGANAQGADDSAERDAP